jgi:SAM-dependent methyltransferase
MDKILKLINDIRRRLDNLSSIIEEEGLKSLSTANQSEFEILRNLLYSEEWPEAVLDFQIVDENLEEEKMDRAEGIVDILIQEELEDKVILDYGCGEGHIAKYISQQKSKKSIGYDISRTEKSKLLWEDECESEGYLLTTNFEKVKENAPYDIIIIYDVLDHTEDPIEILNKASSLLSDNGKIYLRCHPWCGRHGGHLYREINKAFVHVIFTEEELKELGFVEQEFNLKIIYPVSKYEEYIKYSDLKILERDVDVQDVENFFIKNEIISNRLKKIIPVKERFPNYQMSQCFHDYVLGKNS